MLNLDCEHSYEGKYKPYDAKAFLNKQSDSDNINPQHYKSSSGLETIEVIDAFTEGLNGSEAVCTANILKYVCRWKKKNGVEDLKKARWYINHLISILEGAEV